MTQQIHFNDYKGDTMKFLETKTNFNKLKIFLLVLVIVSSIVNIGLNFYLKNKESTQSSLKRMKTITQDMKSQKEDNITYYYPKDLEIIKYLKTFISRDENESSEYFGKTYKYPLSIIIFDSSNSFGKTLNVNPKSVMSEYNTNDKAIYLSIETLAPYLLAHEYTHYKMDSFCIDKKIDIFKIPLWFQEGVSEYVSSAFYNKYKGKSLQEIQNFKKLDSNKELVESFEKGHDVYFQSYLAIKKIIEVKGEGAIQDILINTKSMNFYNAFEKVVGLRIEDFQKMLK